MVPWRSRHIYFPLSPHTGDIGWGTVAHPRRARSWRRRIWPQLSNTEKQTTWGEPAQPQHVTPPCVAPVGREPLPLSLLDNLFVRLGAQRCPWPMADSAASFQGPLVQRDPPWAHHTCVPSSLCVQLGWRPPPERHSIPQPSHLPQGAQVALPSSRMDEGYPSGCSIQRTCQGLCGRTSSLVVG